MSFVAVHIPSRRLPHHVAQPAFLPPTLLRTRAVSLRATTLRVTTFHCAPRQRYSVTLTTTKHVFSMSTPSPSDPSSNSSSLPVPILRIASARAINPLRRPDPRSFTEQQPLPSQRRTDLMAPKRNGFLAALPYTAATALVLWLMWLGGKRFRLRQSDLVEEYAQVLVMYATTPDSMRDITSEYKRKLGPGVLRAAMFGSYLKVLLAEKQLVPETIQDVKLVKKLLRLTDVRAVKAINKLGEELQATPSLLGKLLFISERALSPDALQQLALVPFFPYSPSTVADLQTNMLNRVYSDYITTQIELNSISEPPLDAAALLLVDAAEAKRMFDGVVLAKLKQREREAAELAAAEAEDASKPEVHELDYTARSGEPAKAAVHAYQCTDCGFTLFPAAGREFKFYGDDFVCPTCGAPKSKFVDANAQE